MKCKFHSPPKQSSANKVFKVKCNYIYMYTTYMQKKSRDLGNIDDNI
jgi:hypothetical protein